MQQTMTKTKKMTEEANQKIIESIDRLEQRLSSRIIEINNQLTTIKDSAISTNNNISKIEEKIKSMDIERSKLSERINTIERLNPSVNESSIRETDDYSVCARRRKMKSLLEKIKTISRNRHQAPKSEVGLVYRNLNPDIIIRQCRTTLATTDSTRILEKCSLP